MCDKLVRAHEDSTWSDCRRQHLVDRSRRRHFYARQQAIDLFIVNLTMP